MLCHGGDHLVFGKAQARGRGRKNADVGLMRDQPVEIVDRKTGRLQGFLGEVSQQAHGQLEDGLTVHAQEGMTTDGTTPHAARRGQDAGLTSVRMQARDQDARRVGSRQQHGACAVTEQHAGGTVVPVHDAGKDIRTDDQGTVCDAGTDQRIGIGHGVDEAAADRLHVEGTALMNAQLVLDEAGRAGEDLIRRGGGTDHQIDVVGTDTRHLHGCTRSARTQRRGGVIGAGQPALTDAGTGGDPLVRGLDASGSQIGHQIVVGDAPCRQRRPHTDHPRKAHTCGCRDARQGTGSSRGGCIGLGHGYRIHEKGQERGGGLAACPAGLAAAMAASMRPSRPLRAAS